MSKELRAWISEEFRATKSEQEVQSKELRAWISEKEVQSKKSEQGAQIMDVRARS